MLHAINKTRLQLSNHRINTTKTIHPDLSSTQQPPKHSIPCPFLRKRGWRAKGRLWDFSHHVNPIYNNPPPKHLVPCPFLQKKGRCKKGSLCDFSHDILPRYIYSRPNSHQTVPPAFFGCFQSAPSNSKPFHLSMLRTTYPPQPLLQVPVHPPNHTPRWGM